MGQKPEARVPATLPAGLDVAEVFDWCQKHRAARTYEWYRDHLQDFL